MKFSFLTLALVFVFSSYCFSEEKRKTYDSIVLKSNADFIYQKAANAQLVAAENLQTTLIHIENELHNFETILKIIIWAVGILLAFIGFDHYFKTKRMNEKIATAESYLNESKAILEVSNKNKCEIENFKKETTQNSKDIELLKAKTHLSYKINRIRNHFPVEIFNKGLDFHEPEHHKMLTEIILEFQKIPEDELDISQLSDFYFFKGCEKISTAIKNSKLSDDIFNEALKLFDTSISIKEPEFNFDAYDAKRYIYLYQNKIEEAKIISTKITQEQNIRTEYTIDKKFNDFLKAGYISEPDWVILENELELFKSLNYSEHWKLLIQSNIRRHVRALNSNFIQHLKLNSTYISQDAKGLFAKILFIVDDSTEMATSLFQDAIKIYTIKIANIEAKGNKNKSDYNHLSSLKTELAANKMGLILLTLKANTIKNLDDFKHQMEEVYRLDSRFTKKEGIVELNTNSARFYFTQKEKEFLNKAIRLYEELKNKG